MRRVARGLGGLERNAGFLGLAGALCLAAGSASAAPAPTAFRLSISGTAQQKWDHTAAPVPVGDCARTVRSEATRNVRLRTARPVLVRVAAGRVVSTDVRGLTGTVLLSGANTISDVCGGQRKEAIQDCVLTKRTFRRGRIGLLSTRAGSITLRPVRGVRLRRVNCPREPADVLATPLGPVPGPISISAATFASRRITQITLTASASRHKTYAAPEAGTLQQRSSWTLTFTRVQP